MAIGPAPEQLVSAASPLQATDFFADRRLQLDQTLTGIIQNSALVPEGRIREIYEFSVMNPAAKRQRPILAYAIGEALGATTEQLHNLAAGTELGHAATIIMDDLPDQDDEPQRRGKPAAHIEFSPGEVEVASLHMAVAAVRVVNITDSRLGLNGALTDLAAARLCDLCPGQIMDLSTFRGPSPQAITDIEKLDQVSADKTSPLMELPAVGAVLIARATNPVSEQIADLLERYARHYGIAYQIKDDIDDEVEDRDTNGKSSYISVLEGVEAARAWQAYHAGLADEALEELSGEMDTTRLKEVIAYIGQNAAHR